MEEEKYFIKREKNETEVKKEEDEERLDSKKEETKRQAIGKTGEELSSEAPSFTHEGRKNLEAEEKNKEKEVKDKIKNLLNLAEEKGVEEAIKRAEKENDPFLLDLFHDTLAKEATYKKYLDKK
jgi:glucan-binding YG repeat protein